MPATLYCATTNLHKLEEFQHALAPAYTVQQLPSIREIAPPEETGATFEDNAELKARYYSAFSEDPVFVDDSGLEVNVLHGQPGVHSARYAGEHASGAENNTLLLERMQGATDRTGRFVCVIAIAQRGEVIRTFRGTVEGFLLDAPRGNGGFGYDPLFFYPPFQCTFGEASLDQKTQVSARGSALSAMLAYLTPSSGNIR